VKKVAYENLAAGRTATSSSTLNWPGVVTNEDTWADSGASSSGEFAYTSQTGLQYVQIDLGAVYTADKVKVWHYAGDGRTYHNTKTQVSSDGTNWTTVFDSAVSGEYPETAAGKTHTFTARSVRYVRDYLNGSTSNASNHWVEIEVWGSRTVVYAGAHYEKDMTSGQVTKYYLFGTQRVAMNKGGVVYYLLGDHLGSTSLTLDTGGNKASELRYCEASRSGAEWTSPTGRRVTAGRPPAPAPITALPGRGKCPGSDFTRWGRGSMTLILTASSVPIVLYHNLEIRKV